MSPGNGRQEPKRFGPNLSLRLVVRSADLILSITHAPPAINRWAILGRPLCGLSEGEFLCKAPGWIEPARTCRRSLHLINRSTNHLARPDFSICLMVTGVIGFRALAASRTDTQAIPLSCFPPLIFKQGS